MAKIKTSGKIALIALAMGGVFVGKVFYWDKRAVKAQDAVVTKVVLPDAPEASLSGESKFLPLPSNQESGNGGTKIKWQIMAWNAQMALMYANGGSFTTKGSLFDKANLQVEISRVDDCNKTIADMVKFANEYKNNPNTQGLVAVLMGDGMPAFFAGMYKELKELGPNYMPVGIYAVGKSFGEDQVMGPVDWKQDPKNALGKMVACVLRDGDMNILLKWAGDNGLKVNPDETSYDPEAINLISANDFLDAANKYITGYKEPRKIVVKGMKTSKDTTVGVDAVATWTPGDVNIAQGKGGLVTIASTKQYSSQMPALAFTIKKYAYDHMSDIQNMISALGQAGDQVRSFNEAKTFAANVSAKVYAEKDGSYWLKYYNGVKEKDAQGTLVNLGGSMAFNLSDAANFFGLGNDHLDRYKAVYTTFGDILSKMYPKIMPTYPPYNQVMDKTFLVSVINNNAELMEGNALKTNYSDEITSEVSAKAYSIQFETGSSTIKPESYSMLNEILNSALVAEGLKVGVYGYTDNVGNESSNQILSENRAKSVRTYLISKGLPSNRIEAKGYGSQDPIASNSTSEGRSKNRRVKIVLGE